MAPAGAKVADGPLDPIVLLGVSTLGFGAMSLCSGCLTVQSHLAVAPGKGYAVCSLVIGGPSLLIGGGLLAVRSRCCGAACGAARRRQPETTETTEARDVHALVTASASAAPPCALIVVLLVAARLWLFELLRRLHLPFPLLAPAAQCRMDVPLLISHSGLLVCGCGAVLRRCSALIFQRS